MIPERSGLTSAWKIVEERTTSGNGALTDAFSTVCPSCATLKESVPMNARIVGERVGELIDDIELETVPLMCFDEWSGMDAIGHCGESRKTIRSEFNIGYSYL